MQVPGLRLAWAGLKYFEASKFKESIIVVFQAVWNFMEILYKKDTMKKIVTV